MNILLFTNSFLPQIGGREIVVHYLAREYSRLGHKVRVVKPGGFRSRRRHDFPYRVHRWPTLKGRLTEQVFFAHLLLETSLWPTDIIHAHSTYPCGYAAAWLKKVRSIPLVITPHGADIHVIPGLNFGLRLDPQKDRRIRQALSRADALTAISRNVADSMLDAGAEQSKISLIPNGIDIERFRKAASQNGLSEWLGLGPRDRIILNVGNYRPLKGQDVLIEAMPEVLRQEPRACLVIVGRGTAKLKPLVQRLGLDDRIRLTGGLPFTIGASNGSQDRLAELYANCHLYVSAGIDREAEGLSLALLDAMAAGKPVVATDISGNRDVVADGVNGLLVKPANAGDLARGITTLLADPDRSAGYGRTGLQKAEAMSWTSVARQYLGLYEKLL